MEEPACNLKILVPSGVFRECDEILRLHAETSRGAMGILPHRQDCVVSLVPGILTCEGRNGSTLKVAVDEGILVKTGFNVLVSVRHALEEKAPGTLRASLENEFAAVREREKEMRLALARLETSLVRRMAELTSHG